MAEPDISEANGRPVISKLSGRFTDPALEAIYRAALRDTNLRQTRLSLVVAAALNSSFVLLDPYVYTVNLHDIVFIRMVAVNGALLGAAALSCLPYFLKRWPLLLALAAMAVTALYASTIYVGWAKEIFVGGNVLVVMAIYVLLPFYFVHGVAIAWFSSAVFVISAAFAEQVSLEALLLLIMLMISTHAIGMYALYRTERFLRLNFVNLKTIDAERGRYRDLLARILPRAIAERLQAGEKDIADTIADSSVMFVDIVGFTGIAAATEPDKALQFLNRVFSVFDQLVERRGLEKIKTVGDAYMVAGGLPDTVEDHVGAMADLALDMLDAVRDLKTPDGAPVEIRVGIHAGPLVAGVIGESRFLYDLWGDTVNTANRMESAGTAGHIQVSQAVHDRLAERYAFEPRGEVEVKGKGRLATWYLTGGGSPDRATAIA
jgi:class 3 adenylate cyclase